MVGIKTFDDLAPLEPVYTTQKNDIINEFYIPVLAIANSYDRVTGFFSSTALSVAARGLSKFILNPSSKIRLLVSSKGLEKKDVENIVGIEEEILMEFNQVLNKDIATLTDLIVKKRIAALAWLLKTGRLEIKVVKMTAPQFMQGMLHSKFGILTDAIGNKICFSGSINESQQGWKINGEVISVYKSTMEGQKRYINKYNEEFYDYWNNAVKDATVIDLPRAIKDKLLEYSCDNVNEVIDFIDPETKFSPPIKLRYYQSEAITNWANNNQIGFFEMATGTGKTITATFAVKNLIEKNKNIGIIIAVPTNPLVVQWKKDLIEQGFEGSDICCCSSDYLDWKTTFRRYILLSAPQTKLFIFTYQSLRADDVQEMIKKTTRDLLLVCDEMHHAGAPEFSKCLNPKIKYRLGLSATPIRAHDIEGTETLLNYFGHEPLLMFDITRALNETDPTTNKTYLCPYNYYFETAELSPKEYADFKKLSQQIALKQNKPEQNEEFQPDKLRALLISCASEKIDILDNLVKTIKDRGEHKKILFYCQSFKSKDLGEKQIESVKKVLDKNSLNYLEFTAKFDDLDFRDKMLGALRADAIDAIVSIKCLDEGINIPEIRTAVVLASSSNSAEFIQRRGRILRNAPGKSHANLHDFLVGPPHNVKLQTSDMSLIKREYVRATEYAKHAVNSKESVVKIQAWLQSYGLAEGDLYD